MTLNRIEINKILKLLHDEVVPSVGCTEPMAVALAVAKCRELLQCTPEHVSAKLSGNIIKNAMGVGIPGSDGMVGLPAAIALGAVAGKAELNLEVLRDVQPSDLELAKTFIEERRFDIRQARNTFEILYIDIEAEAAGHRAKVIIAKEHTHYIYLKLDDQTIVDERHTLAKEHDRNHESWLNMQKVYDFAMQVPLEQISFLLDGARMNKNVAQMAFEGNYGLNLGKMLRKGVFEERMVGHSTMPRLVCYTCAACDVRMSGARVPVMSNSGSGNQGIACSMPVLVFAEDVQASEAKLIRALALSNLTVIYIKQLLGRLSAHCGCVVAATGSACGITYLMDGDFDAICAAIKNQIASLTGMLCDGAKPSCTLKLSSAVSSAFQAAMMAMEGICVASTDGIIEEDIDRSIDNLAGIGRDAMIEVDNMILNIMTEKGEQR
ncbi:MAG: serine dehydratase subunit alpha family protein [Bacteroidales bacterium]|nr:serine dehydratase subunit alpha family protein [Candidatus Liminaster caballi]